MYFISYYFDFRKRWNSFLTLPESLNVCHLLKYGRKRNQNRYSKFLYLIAKQCIQHLVLPVKLPFIWFNATSYTVTILVTDWKTIIDIKIDMISPYSVICV